jgi:purine nucleosidase
MSNSYSHNKFVNDSLNLNPNENNNNNDKWIIDTDPGIDDSFAIILGMTYLKENLIALSIGNGNVGIDGCFINAKKICVIKDFHVPIYKGCYLNLSGVNFEASDFHGKDDLLNLEEFEGYDKKYREEKFMEKLKNLNNPLIDKFSPLKIIELSYKYPKNLSILLIGPLTNIATAIMIDPSLPQRINKVVIMGGSYTSLGNIKSNVEFNFACDPIAAKKVFDSFNFDNNEIILYPWETCMEHLIMTEHLELIGKFDSTTKRFCERIINKKINFPGYGIFADFGSAVYMTNKNSIKNSLKKYIDISIDSNDSNFGQICIENDYRNKIKRNFNQENTENSIKNFNLNLNANLNRKKVEIITNLDKDIYYDCFMRMNEL